MNLPWKPLFLAAALGLAGLVHGHGATRLTVRDAEVTAGGVGWIPIELSTGDEVVAAQFDVVVASTNLLQRGATAGGAAARHVVHFHPRAPGVGRVVIHSPENAALVGGSIAEISVGVPAAMPAGIMTVTLTNVLCVTRNATRLTDVSIEPGSLVIQRGGLLRFASMARNADGAVELTLVGGVIGQRYLTEASETLAGWIPISIDPVPPTGTLFLRDDGAAGLSQRFYRTSLAVP